MTKVKTLTIQFDTPLRRSEIPLFRGAVIAAIPSSNILFHNHDGTALRYAYPLIQYKRIGGKAAIVCIGEGVEAVGEFFAAGNNKEAAIVCIGEGVEAVGEFFAAGNNKELKIGEKQKKIFLERVNALHTEVQCWDTSFDYQIRDWLPLNEENFKIFNETESLIERTKILEKILTGNILSFAKGIGIQIKSNIAISITAVENIREVRYKRIPLRCMDIQFKSNISLPEFVGLGKHSSVGFGIITRNNHKQNK